MGFIARPTPAGRMPQYAPGISSPFGISSGYRNGKYFHHGQDYFFLNADVAGSRRCLSVGVGRVQAVFWSDSMGGVVHIDYGGGVFARYNHMPRDSAAVTVGQTVDENTFIGPMGNAGTDAFGQYHLHFEVWVNNTRVDPAPYFSATAGGGTLIPEEYEETEMPRYIWTNENPTVNGIGYALFDTGYVDGVIVTGDVGEANRLSRVAADRNGVPGAPALVSRAEFNQQCADATWLWRQYAPKPGAAGAGASKTDVDAAAKSVIEAIPAAATATLVTAEADRVIRAIPTKAVLS